MSSYDKRQYILGGAVVICVFLFIFAVNSLLKRTDLKDINMDPGADMDWSYEIISGSVSRPAVPELLDEYTVSFPGESGRAVKAERTLREQLDGAHIGIFLYDAVCGADVYLDDDMIYTSFEGAPRDESGYALTDGFEPCPSEKIEIFLPDDYVGRKLTVISYFPSETENIVPIFPYLCSSETLFALTSVENVAPITHMTLCSFLTLLTALIYLLDIKNGNADKRILLLTLFYLILFMQQGFESNAGTYSLLPKKLGALEFICELRMAPLLLFVALYLTSWRRVVLAAATGVWFVFDAVKLIREWVLSGLYHGEPTAPIVFALIILTLILLIFEMRYKKIKFKKSYIIYIIIAVVAAVVRLIRLSSKWYGNMAGYLKLLFVSPMHGVFYPLIQYVFFIGIFTITAVVIVEFVRRTLYSRVMLGVLEEQNKRAMNSYKRMAESEEETYSIRHEVRHHMLTLSAMLKNGEIDRAGEYAQSLTSEYNDMPDGQYSKNMMVNIIASEYLGRAKPRGIEVKHSLNIPEEIPISDTDFCVFLTNMFENSLNACEKIDPGQKRYIHVKMYIQGKYLFIGCENSAPNSEAAVKKDKTHGYGLENMKRIAQKYGGMLHIERKNSSFALKSDFCLK